MHSQFLVFYKFTSIHVSLIGNVHFYNFTLLIIDKLSGVLYCLHDYMCMVVMVTYTTLYTTHHMIVIALAELWLRGKYGMR